ncbi:hypothetical protein M8J77_001503 [Diaphorina citri]|nr:hypothetical protein M8J77_001503 [Diaphorina citri]
MKYHQRAIPRTSVRSYSPTAVGTERRNMKINLTIITYLVPKHIRSITAVINEANSEQRRNIKINSGRETPRGPRVWKGKPVCFCPSRHSCAVLRSLFTPLPHRAEVKRGPLSNGCKRRTYVCVRAEGELFPPVE